MENHGLSAPTGGIVQYIHQLAESNAQRLAARIALRKEEMGGEYHSGDSAWSYVKNHTGVDLKAILEAMAKERASGD